MNMQTLPKQWEAVLTPDYVLKAPSARSITLKRHNLPMTVRYEDKTYILVLTKSGKLLLQKPLE